MPGVVKVSAPLVAPAEMLPVVQAPVSEVAVWVAGVEFVQLTLDPAGTLIGLGEKHQVVEEQVTIWAGEVAALAPIAPPVRIT